MMPGLQDGDTATFLRVLPQDSGVHTRWWRYPKDGGVGVFSYKMSVLPTRWRRAYKMAALPKRWWLYPQDGGIPTKWQCFCEFYHKMAALPMGVFVLMKCRRYQQDGGFTHKMPTRWRQCRVSASFTHKMVACIQDGGIIQKMAAWEFFPIKCRRYPQDGDEAVLPTRWQRYEQDGGFTHKMAVYLQNDNVYASFTQRSDSCDNKKNNLN